MLDTSNRTEQEVLDLIKEAYNNLVFINKPKLTSELVQSIKDAISYSNLIDSSIDPKIIYQQLVFYHSETIFPTEADLDILATILFDLPFTEFHKTEKEKALLSHSTVGGYPLIYFTTDDSYLCPDCATEEHKEYHNVIAVKPFMEGESVCCCDCGNIIEPAYQDQEQDLFK